EVCQTVAKRGDHSYARFPSFQFLSRVCLTIPVDNCWPERGFSQMKRIKSKERNRIGTKMLQYLMNIKLNCWAKMIKAKALQIAERWHAENERRVSGQKQLQQQFATQQTNQGLEAPELVQQNIYETSEFVFE
ncbi:MAG: hypothetical protein EZS28_019849, partial [Streblomastix strix]